MATDSSRAGEAEEPGGEEQVGRSPLHDVGPAALSPATPGWVPLVHGGHAGPLTLEGGCHEASPLFARELRRAGTARMGQRRPPPADTER